MPTSTVTLLTHIKRIQIVDHIHKAAIKHQQWRKPVPGHTPTDRTSAVPSSGDCEESSRTYSATPVTNEDPPAEDELLQVVSNDDASSLSELTEERRRIFTFDLPDPFPPGFDVPEWFKLFYNQYQKNENRKVILMQEMHLEMINYEIRKCELLRDIIQKLRDP